MTSRGPNGTLLDDPGEPLMPSDTTSNKRQSPASPAGQCTQDPDMAAGLAPNDAPDIPVLVSAPQPRDYFESLAIPEEIANLIMNAILMCDWPV